MPLFKKDQKPILAVDIDGVISLFGFDKQKAGAGVGSASSATPPHEQDPPGEFHLIDGMVHCISMPTGPQLNRLAETYELVWASGWEDRANDHLPGILGVPTLPYLTFGGRAVFGTAHWKLDALDDYAGDRPLAWIDDSLDRSCYQWAEERKAPTLLVPTDSARGLEEAHVEALEAWARDGFAPR